MMKRLAIIAVMSGFAAPVFADGHAVSGDVINGEAQFARQCVACHVVRDAQGEVLAGRNAKAGPNLYQIASGPVAGMEGFPYGDSISTVGQTGLTWSEASFVAYVQNPTQWLRDTLDNRRARSKMGYKVRSASEAADIYAYLASLDPA